MTFLGAYYALAALEHLLLLILLQQEWKLPSVKLLMHLITNSVSYMIGISFIDQNQTTVLLTQLIVSELYKKFTKNGRHFCFLAVTFFVLKVEKMFFLAQIETWCFRRF